MSLLIFVMPNIFSEKTEDLKNLFQKTSVLILSIKYMQKSNLIVAES